MSEVTLGVTRTNLNPPRSGILENAPDLRTSKTIEITPEMIETGVYAQMMFKHETLGLLTPNYNFLAFPEKEQRESIQFMVYVGEIWEAVRFFNSALALFNFCNDQTNDHFRHDNELLKHSTTWKLIAARDGVWSIYNLGITMKNVRSGLGTLPTLRSLLDHKKLRTAQKKFEAWFPDYERIRHALGHSPELMKNKNARAKNYYIGPFKSDGMIISGESTQIMIKNSLLGNVYQTTFAGRLLCYEISQTTLNKLVEVKDGFYSGFQRVDEQFFKAANRPNQKVTDGR